MVESKTLRRWYWTNEVLRWLPKLRGRKPEERSSFLTPTILQIKRQPNPWHSLTAIALLSINDGDGHDIEAPFYLKFHRLPLKRIFIRECACLSIRTYLFSYFSFRTIRFASFAHMKGKAHLLINSIYWIKIRRRRKKLLLLLSSTWRKMGCCKVYVLLAKS